MGFSYADAVMLMGGKKSRSAKAIDGLLGGAVLAASAATGGLVPNLFEAKGELVSLSDALIQEIGQRIRGLDRYTRSQRLVAAHAVVALAAYFEILEQAELPFELRRLKLTKSDQAALAGGDPSGRGRALGALADGLLRIEIPMPSPQQPSETALGEMRAFYRILSTEVETCASALNVMESADGANRARCHDMLVEKLPDRAVLRYAERFRQLAVDFPEIAFWANQIDHQATRTQIRELGAGLTALTQMLAGVVSGQVPDERRLGLNRVYQDALRRPVLTTGEIHPGLTLPILRDAYIIPGFKAVKVAGNVAQELSNESWWGGHSVRNDLEEFLFGYLISEQAAQTPLLVLGQPGSGKSVLTQMLAAQLPPDNFLVVRVVLREVAVEADLQTQIEEAVRAATGENLAWPDLVRSAGGALPVVLLDGFDELLQATGVSQSDYVEKVATFQAREMAIGRPTAILITSRMAVADRSTPPQGTVVARLEPFHEAQIRKWVNVWNQTNAPAFEDGSLDQLAAEAVLEHVELASQPLLLAMLALYDGGVRRLQQATENLSEAELYERLLASFAEREVRKSHEGGRLSEEEVRDGVERELLRLSVVAFAMLVRSRQWASEAELDNDLPALLGTSEERSAPRGLRAPLTAAQVVVGRFFFVHEAQATRDNVRLHTYEFLHATFGEYLIARLVTRELVDLADAARLASARTRREPPDDSFLYALLSHMPLTMRGTIVAFAAERIRSLPNSRRRQLSSILVDLFRSALAPRHETRYGDYSPIPVPITARAASYSANLAILAVLSADEIQACSLFEENVRDPVAKWNSMAMLWRSQLPSEGWDGLMDALALDRIWSEDKRDIILRYNLVKEDSFRDIDPYWSYNRGPQEAARARGRPFGWSRRRDSRIRRQSWFLCDEYDDVVTHALQPFMYELDGLIYSFHSYWPANDQAVSTANALGKLFLAASLDSSPDELVGEFDICLEIAIRARFGSDTSGIREPFRKIVLGLLSANRSRVPEAWYFNTIKKIGEAATAELHDVHEAGELLRVVDGAIPGFRSVFDQRKNKR